MQIGFKAVCLETSNEFIGFHSKVTTADYLYKADLTDEGAEIFALKWG